jgi:hypothetical protein
LVDRSAIKLTTISVSDAHSISLRAQLRTRYADLLRYREQHRGERKLKTCQFGI